MWKKNKSKAPQDTSPGPSTGSGPIPTGPAPPAYTSDPPSSLTDPLENLSIAQSPTAIPTEAHCLAHLRLLYAFNRLKTEKGYRNGLWNIFDSRAGSQTSAHDSKKAAIPDPAEPSIDILVKLREKRWAVYVARAVSRYEAWWSSFVPDMLLENDMLDPDEGRKDRYEGFVRREGMVWNADMLPPLDVLLVWHAHMLNPRIYLEDCLRYGHAAVWAAGMPWAIVNAAIRGPAFEYVASDACVAHWTSRTNLAWRNEDDPDTKEIKCPSCATMVSVSWTTCGQEEGYQGSHRPGLSGSGLADGHLSQACPCTFTITHQALRTAKLLADIQASIKQGHAMPGTILDLQSGMPKLLSSASSSSTSSPIPDQLFPSHLARRGLLSPLLSLLTPGSPTPASMTAVRDVIEETFTGKFADPKNLRELMSRHGHKKVTEFRLSLEGRRQTRKMMSRYWENASLLGIDLVGCVMRQAVFTEKMCKINWLSLPTAQQTMSALLTKYTRFMTIVSLASSTKDRVAVPTVDVDLAWHTHQLSPRAYYDYTIAETAAFVDHNDKVDEDKLSTAFDWTCKTYQERFGEVYSECKCWYCETVRVMALPATKMFASGKEEKLLEAWHSSPDARNVPIPPAAESAHVSSHPAVHTNETTSRRAHTRPLRLDYRNRLEETHSKARKRANKTFKADQGKRMGPRGEDMASFWGKEFPVQGPWAASLAATTTSEMYPSPPGFSAWFGGKSGCAGFAGS
ncbi:Glycine-rich domain-containing protein 1 [Colletotrichum tropicale]|nr:Glycine-rich domain-containing protein 1 [Colletotrichum tropicale]